MMRLRRLDLTRYGHFTDYRLELGPRKPGQSDLHIIFGANEAGKSTAFEAYLDLLFAIAPRSRYNFLHSYENMRIGACLEIDGVEHEVIRIKKQRNDLLDGAGNPLNPALLAGALGGLDRDRYRAMLSLNNESIKKGGDDILASQGDLGQLLFSAAAGLSELGEALEAARERAAGFHRKSARKSVLVEKRKALKALEEQIRALDLNAGQFRTLHAAQERAASQERAARSRRDALLGDKARLEAIATCLPLLDRLSALRADLEKVQIYSRFDPLWPEQARTLREREAAARAKAAAARQAVEKLRKKHGMIERDGAMLALGDELEHLMEGPRARARTARDDLEKRSRELAGLSANIERTERDLATGEIDAQQLGEPVLGKLERLANAVLGAREALATAQGEVRDAGGELDEISDAKAGGVPEPARADQLHALLARFEPEALTSHLRDSEAQLKRLQRAMSEALANLAPWQGQSQDLPVAMLTHAQARRIGEEHGALHEAAKMLQREYEAVERDLASINARIEAMKTDANLYTDQEANAARARRDAAWEQHLQALSAQSAEAFHRQLVALDAIQNARLEAADRLAALRQLQLKAAELSAQRADCKARLLANAQAKEAHQEDFQGILQGLGLPDGFDPRDLWLWLKSLASAQEVAAQLAQAREDQARAQADVAKAAAALRKALELGEEGGDLAELARQARARLNEAGRLAERARAIAQARAKLARRRQQVVACEQSLADATAQWRRQVAAGALKYDDAADFRDALPALRQLGLWMSQRDSLRHRIVEMEKDAEEFSRNINKLFEALGVVPEEDPLRMAQKLQARLREAEQNEQARLALELQIQEQQQALENAEGELALIARAVAQMAHDLAAGPAIETTADLWSAVEKARQADALRAQIAGLETRISTELGQRDFADASALLAGKDMVGVSARLRACESDLTEAEARLEGAIGDLRAASDALLALGGDDAVARLQEQRQVLLLDIQERARAALRLQLGAMLAGQALGRYRQAHRSAMLADTERAFDRLTGGRYRQLVTQPDGQKEQLLAVDSQNSRSISVAEMSSSTAFQLYLALRLAGYRQFVASGTSLPFLADDILETFDNSRTAAALELLGEISMHGQALYFTHHRHVVDLARERLGEGVQIHDLSQARQV